jgi:hypothetical protein
MAALTDMLGWISGSRAREDARVAATREAAECCDLRKVAFEDVFWYVKRIDNSKVVREANPRERGACWRMIGSAGLAVLLLLGVLLPNVYNFLSGHEIQVLMAKQEQILKDRARMDLEEARLLSPERLAKVAHDKNYKDAAPERVVYLMDTAHNGQRVALNVAGGESAEK